VANPVDVGPKLCNLAVSASLNHNPFLHDPTARADEWMLGEKQTSWGSDGRVFIHQRFWNSKTGRLVMSGTQESVMRLKQGRL
jgi:acyl-CoA thioesterase II